MSWISKLTGVHLGNVGAPIGAAIGSVIPGLGTALGAGLGQGLGAIGAHKSPVQALEQGAMAYGGAKGLQAIASHFGHGDSTHAGGDSGQPSSGSTDSGNGGGGWLSTIGGFLGDHKKDILDYGSAAENAYGNYQGAKKYADNAPLRSAGRAGLLDTSTPDLSGILGTQGAPPQYRNVTVGSRGRAG